MGVVPYFTNDDEHWMRRALDNARQADQAGEVPVGAVLVRDNQLIAEGFNQPITSHDTTAHAEIVTLRAAGQVDYNYRFPDTTLYVTLEPCPMCAGALIHARVTRLVFAASDPKTGAAGSVFNLLLDSRHNHHIEVQGGLLADESSELLKAFFQARR